MLFNLGTMHTMHESSTAEGSKVAVVIMHVQRMRVSMTDFLCIPIVHRFLCPKECRLLLPMLEPRALRHGATYIMHVSFLVMATHT